MRQIEITVNKKNYKLAVPVNRTLLEILREELGLTGAKEGCGIGECGACTVIMSGKTVNACLVLAVEADGKEITTIEGLADGEKLHPLQQAFMEVGGVQCGFCTPGMIMSAKALLDSNQNPSDDDIKRAIAGNLCRCTGYTKIIESINTAAKMMGGK